MGKRKKTRVSEEDLENEDEETRENQEYLVGLLRQMRRACTRGGYIWNVHFGAVMNNDSWVDKAASQQEIKKAYYKLALRLHPDKNPDDEEAKEKFQQLQKVISILGDEEKVQYMTRQAVLMMLEVNIYDDNVKMKSCPELDIDLAGDAIQNLRTFFRTMYKKISEADIEEFEANYRGSDSEKKDLLELYKKCKGNMDRYTSVGLM
ncbi:Chaperone protein dnaJ 6 [Sesamum angolense]|uniref:Chaperone protein dnaJ 6 n=1 Tax=Sesamum angolense TaxID=2727404 RepID=A0AAE1WFI0_9LAMI|nr:Chaperone protein dnaJ 6 [Sesamum angolense]